MHTILLLNMINYIIYIYQFFYKTTLKCLLLFIISFSEFLSIFSQNFHKFLSTLCLSNFFFQNIRRYIRYIHKIKISIFSSLVFTYLPFLSGVTFRIFLSYFVGPLKTKIKISGNFVI